MSLFVCDSCGCVDNTALGCYWERNIAALGGTGQALCTECHEGEWHGRFPKEKWDGKCQVINRAEGSGADPSQAAVNPEAPQPTDQTIGPE